MTWTQDLPITHRGQAHTIRTYDTTRYELVAELGRERRRITYSARKTHQIMVRSCWEKLDALLAFLALTPDTPNTIEGKGDRLAFVFPNGARIFWGRTEREAITEGELTSI